MSLRRGERIFVPKPPKFTLEEIQQFRVEVRSLHLPDIESCKFLRSKGLSYRYISRVMGWGDYDGKLKARSYCLYVRHPHKSHLARELKDSGLGYTKISKALNISREAVINYTQPKKRAKCLANLNRLLEEKHRLDLSDFIFTPEQGALALAAIIFPEKKEELYRLIQPERELAPSLTWLKKNLRV